MYKIKDVATILKVSDRSVERYLKSYFYKESGTYIITDKMLEILKEEHLDEPNDTVVEEFTKDEYQEFHKRLSEYPILKDRISDILNELEYHKRSSESHNRQMEIILRTLEQRNYIEAKDKRIN